MKKIITIIILLTSLISKSQCPAPSDLILSQQITMAELLWTENGTATAWEATLIPDFYIGADMPTNGTFVTSNSALFTGLPPAYGCYAFFVRSWCSPTDVSPWVAVGSLGCSSNVYNYLATLSNDNLPSPDEFQVFPNPATTNVQIKSTSKIRNIRIFDTLGKLIVTQTQSTDDINVENLGKGVYIIEASTEKGVVYTKLIKE